MLQNCSLVPSDAAVMCLLPQHCLHVSHSYFLRERKLNKLQINSTEHDLNLTYKYHFPVFYSFEFPNSVPMDFTIATHHTPFEPGLSSSLSFRNHVLINFPTSELLLSASGGTFELE